MQFPFLTFLLLFFGDSWWSPACVISVLCLRRKTWSTKASSAIKATHTTTFLGDICCSPPANYSIFSQENHLIWTGTVSYDSGHTVQTESELKQRCDALGCSSNWNCSLMFQNIHISLKNDVFTSFILHGHPQPRFLSAFKALFPLL